MCCLSMTSACAADSATPTNYVRCRNQKNCSRTGNAGVHIAPRPRGIFGEPRTEQETKSRDPPNHSKSKSGLFEKKIERAFFHAHFDTAFAILSCRVA